MAVGTLSYMGKVNSAFMANLSIFAVASFRMLPFVSQLSGCLNILMFAYEPVTAALDNLKVNIAVEDISQSGNDDKKAGEKIKGFDHELTFHDVSFTYSTELPNPPFSFRKMFCY